MRPRRGEIARWPDRKIARLVDDLEICPRLASTAMSAPRRRKTSCHSKTPTSDWSPGDRRPPRGARRARLRRRVDRRRSRHRPLPGLGHSGLAARLVLRRASRPGAGGWDAARPGRRFLRSVRPGRVGADPAGAGQSAAGRAGGDRHHHGRADYAGRRRHLRGARRHRRPVRHRPAALQAWHIMGSEGSLADGASTFLFLLTAALPAWPPGPSRAGWPGPRCCSPFSRCCPARSASWPPWSSWPGPRPPESPCWSRASPVRSSPTPTVPVKEVRHA